MLSFGYCYHFWSVFFLPVFYPKRCLYNCVFYKDTKNQMKRITTLS
jgi:hypothetical protein